MSRTRANDSEYEAYTDESEEEREEVGYQDFFKILSKPASSASVPKHASRSRKPYSLNIRRSYCKSWEPWAGVRELVQNWRDGLIKDGSSFEDVEIVLKDSKGNSNKRIWIATRKVQSKATGGTSGATNPGMAKKKASESKGQALGEISWIPNATNPRKNKLELVNYGVSLGREVLTVGHSEKRFQGEFVGGHGEGMKVGINTLLRAGVQDVQYHTNGEKWSFIHDAYDTLAVKFLKSTRKDNTKDTRVVVVGLREPVLLPDRFLFLSKPSEEHVSVGRSMSDPSGYVIVDGPFRRNLYVAGIFVRQFQPDKEDGLQYGYNIPAGIQLNRDRTLVDDEMELGTFIYTVWQATFRNANVEQASTALRRFLVLFEKFPSCMDIKYSSYDIEPAIAKMLFKELLAMHGGENCWLYSIAGGTTEIHIIETSLRKKSQGISSRLWNVFQRHKLVRTAEEQRTEMFQASEMSTALSFPCKFIDYSVHLFKCFLQLHPDLIDCKYSFRSVAANVDIDAAKVKLAGQSEVYINHRNLLPTWVHKENDACVPYSIMQSHAPHAPSVSHDDQDLVELWEYNRRYFENLTCPCIANRLAHLMEDELLRYESPIARYNLVNRRVILTATMPRNMRVRPHMIDGKLEMQVKFDRMDPVEGVPEPLFHARIWEVSSNEEAKLVSERVIVADQSFKDDKVESPAGTESPPSSLDATGKMVHGKTPTVVLCELDDQKNAEDDDNITTDVKALDVQDKNETPTQFPLVLSRVPVEKLCFHGCIPGIRYRVQVRLENVADNLRSFHCPPLEFCAPLPPPQDLTVSRSSEDQAKLTVSWKPVERADTYIVKLLDSQKEMTLCELTTSDCLVKLDSPEDAIFVVVSARLTSGDDSDEDDMESFEPGETEIPKPAEPEPEPEPEAHETPALSEEMDMAPDPESSRSTSDWSWPSLSNDSTATTPTPEYIPTGTRKRPRPLSPRDVVDEIPSKKHRSESEQITIEAIHGTADSDSDNEPGDMDFNMHEEADEPEVRNNNDEDEDDLEIEAELSDAEYDFSQRRVVWTTLPRILIQGIAVLPNHVIEYERREKERRHVPGKRYIGLVRHILQNPRNASEVQLHVTQFERLCDYVGLPSNSLPLQDELLMHSKRSKAATSQYETVKVLKLDSFADVRLARYQKVIHTNRPHLDSPPTDAFICRWMLVQTWKSKGTSIVRPPIDLIPADLQERPTQNDIPLSTTVADIYTQGGAKSQGFAKAGFDCEFSVDDSVTAHATYTRNFPNARAHCQDPDRFFDEFLNKKFDLFEATVVLASPPLENISQTGFKTENADGSTTFDVITRIARQLIPPFIMADMSIKVLNSKHRLYFNRILFNLLQSGYSVMWRTIHSLDFGLPHTQSRVVLIAARAGLQLPEWPQTVSQSVTVREAISDLNDLDAMENDTSGFCQFNEEALRASQSAYASSLFDISENEPWLFNHGSLGALVEPDENWVRAEWDKPLSTEVHAKLGAHWPCIHPSRGDVLTVRELARIMSFPDSFVFLGSLEAQYDLVGSSIAPRFAEMCAEMIKQRIA